MGVEVSEVRIRRADRLPASIQKELGIYDGLVEINVVENSPKRIVSIKQTNTLFSERLKEAYEKEQLKK